MKRNIYLLAKAIRKIGLLKNVVKKQEQSYQSLLELNSECCHEITNLESRIKTLRDYIAYLEVDYKRMTERDEKLMAENKLLRDLVSSLEKELEQSNRNHTS